jgi:hypothetical protein
MKRPRFLTALALLAAFSALLRVARADDDDNQISIDPDSFAAVAYSPSARTYHCAYGYEDRWAAEKAALAACKAKDVRAVGWVNNGFFALALGDDKSQWGIGYTYGDGASSREAEQIALKDCNKRTTHAYIAVCLSSDGQHFRKGKAPRSDKMDYLPPQPETGGTIVRNPDGSSVETKADGTQIVRNANGSSRETQPNGTKIVKNPDGSSVETRADGTEIVTDKDGSSVETRPDGTTITKEKK